MESHFLLGIFSNWSVHYKTPYSTHCLFSGPISCLERSEYSMKSVLLHDRKWDYIVLFPVSLFILLKSPKA